MKQYDQCMFVIIKNECIGFEYLPRVILKDVEKMRNYKYIGLSCGDLQISFGTNVHNLVQLLRKQNQKDLDGDALNRKMMK